MPGPDRQKALAEARTLEQSGDHIGAIRAYIHAGYAMDASRLLANMGRFGEAGDLLLKALRLDPAMVGTLTGARRSAALKAAVCFARAERFSDAATIVVALGARESVIGTLLEVDDAEALRCAYGLLRDEGLALGLSSGTNVAGAVQVARALGPGHTVVTILCDLATRYASKMFNADFLEARSLPAPDWLAHGNEAGDEVGEALRAVTHGDDA